MFPHIFSRTGLCLQATGVSLKLRMTSSTMSSMKKFQVVRKTDDFRAAVELVSCPVPTPGPKEILIRNRFVGINASDINMTAGRYDFAQQMPFTPGMEAVGEVAQFGEACKSFRTIGQPVGFFGFGSFAEYSVVSEEAAFPLPEVKAEYIPLIVSGLAATIAMDKTGELQDGETVLVTAAAGGTGQMAVQWAKARGCHVIGTCSSEPKVEMLKEIDCDRAVNVHKENLTDVLTEEYEKGINLVFESVGGDQLVTAISGLAIHGRVVLIGSISNYHNGVFGEESQPLAAVPLTLVVKSASLRGFILFHFPQYYHEYMAKQVAFYKEGKIKPHVDTGRFAERDFKGVEAISDAVEYLYTRKSLGKIVVEL